MNKRQRKKNLKNHKCPFIFEDLTSNEQWVLPQSPGKIEIWRKPK